VAAHDHPPLSIPDHELIECIGRGSYGEVWRARNVVGTGRAVKVVLRERFGSERPYEREFAGIQKFEPVSRRHEGVVDILHLGRAADGSHFYYVMELADDVSSEFGVLSSTSAANPAKEISRKEPEGSEAKLRSYMPKTLRAVLQSRGRLPLSEVVELGADLCGALAHLHLHGLVHRDVKPSNLIYAGGRPKLADIGLVTGLDEARSFVGTEGYIPPEGPGSVQADLYSLGKVLYEAATGKDRHDFPDLPPPSRCAPNCCSSKPADPCAGCDPTSGC
jgi:serine/threonine protein kinase